MTKPLVIVGAGGFGREVASLIEAENAVSPRWNVLGFLDDAPSDDDRARVRAIGLGVLGAVELMSEMPPATAVLAIGSGPVRQRLSQSPHAVGWRWATLIHPDATLGQNVKLGEGVVVCAGARLSANITIGNHAHIDQNVTVGHDCTIGDFVRLNPQACISGSVDVQELALVGASAVVLQGLTVGRRAIVGAAACAVRHVAADATVKGVPAR